MTNVFSKTSLGLAEKASGGVMEVASAKSSGQPIRGYANSSNISYLAALANVDADPRSRSREAFQNHTWVFAAAIACAWNVSQAPFVVMQETAEAIAGRKQSYATRNQKWPGIKHGANRRAIQRHGRTVNRWLGVKDKALEPYLDHYLSGPLEHPGDGVASGNLLWYMTTLWYKIRGEAFWILTDAEGNPVPIGEQVAQIHPVTPDCFTEVMLDNKLAGWRMRVDRGYGFERQGKYIYLDLDEVVHFKFPDPYYPVRGMSPLTAAAMAINLDMLSDSSNKGLLENGAEPNGILYHEGVGGAFKSREEKEEFYTNWRQRHEGSGNYRRTALLTGGWRYQPTTLTPRDMDYLSMKKWDRDQILAVMQTPKSVLAVTDDLPYAAQIGQDRNFWDKGLLPIVRMFEQQLDQTLFYLEPDSVMGLFDLTQIEALRAGLENKVDIAIKLTSNNLHMPPDQAYAQVGLAVGSYLGSDTSFVRMGYIPADKVVNPDPGMPGGPPLPSDAPRKPPENVPGEGDPTPVGDGNGATTDPAANSRSHKKLSYKTRTADQKLAFWKSAIQSMQLPAEKSMRRSWREYIATTKRKNLMAFDHAEKSLGLPVTRTPSETDNSDQDVERLLVPLATMQSDLATLFQPEYALEMKSVFDATIQEIGGVASISLTDPRFTKALNARVDKLIGTAPQTLQTALRKSLIEGINGGETVQQLRARVAAVYDISAASAKALMVARTESAGMMNDVRAEVFSAAGFKKTEWTTAGDEHVRADHAVFGSLGPQDIGHNYMEDVGKAGTLTRPSDPEGPADEVINCRCVQIPTE